MTQAQAVIETIEMLGGIATLNQINQNIFKIEDCQWRTKTPFASVRRLFYQVFTRETGLTPSQWCEFKTKNAPKV